MERLLNNDNILELVTLLHCRQVIKGAIDLGLNEVNDVLFGGFHSLNISIYV